MSYEMKTELISEMEEHECLWNPSHEDYHKLDKKNQAWNRLQENLELKGFQTDLFTLETQWKSLRNRWKRLQNPTTGSSAGGSSSLSFYVLENQKELDSPT